MNSLEIITKYNTNITLSEKKVKKILPDQMFNKVWNQIYYGFKVNMFNAIKTWLKRRVIKHSRITTEQWDRAFDKLPLLNGLTVSERQTLIELAIIFIHRKVFESGNGFEIKPHMKLIIALQACLPILHLGIDCYNGWTSIIVYPSGFSPKRVFTDEYGVEHQVQSNLLGESWQRGPVVLAWDETEFAGIIDGNNLVIHEFAHKLDMQNGVANGFPPLHATMHSKDWVDIFSDGYKKHQQQCSHHKSHDIDCYAASSPAEFFAVLSEVFFERPAVIQKHYVAIYNQLKLYYRQDPISRFPA